ncbi:MAG: outer membrane lipoprotein carrier protein LolA [Bacteroidetes bacterium]|nr:outer membrane lipoprotein carrier protein LolA [Bacteroidota bacterium]
MKKLIILFLSLAFVNVYGQKDQKAIEILDQVSAKTKAYKSIKADFSYKMENAKAKINEEKQGTLLLSGDKYKMQASGQTVICDGKTIWTFMPESNEVQINSLDNKDEALTPSKLLSNYNTNFKSKILSDKNNDPNTIKIELVPNTIKNYNKAILAVDKAKLQVKSFVIYDKNGNIFTYTITRFQTDLPLNAADFTFDAKKFPGVEVIDMR